MPKTDLLAWIARFGCLQLNLIIMTSEEERQASLSTLKPGSVKKTECPFCFGVFHDASPFSLYLFDL